jgi:hypothetical protein
MDATKIIKQAIDDNPDIRLVLDIAARAREAQEREPAKDLRASTDVGANPTTSQGIVFSGHVLCDQRNLIS